MIGQGYNTVASTRSLVQFLGTKIKIKYLVNIFTCKMACCSIYVQCLFVVLHMNFLMCLRVVFQHTMTESISVLEDKRSRSLDDLHTLCQTGPAFTYTCIR